MGFGFGANKIFRRLPFLCDIRPHFRHALQAALGTIRFKRHIVHIYAQSSLRDREQMFMVGALSLCI